MAKFEIVMPKLGESIIEATITKWLKQVGDTIQEDDAILEIATDKVDSEIPSPVDGILLEKKFDEGEVVAVGKVIAVIDTGGSAEEGTTQKEEIIEEKETTAASQKEETPSSPEVAKEPVSTPKDNRYYSPLVKNIAKKEHIAAEELANIKGTGKEGRVTKRDLLSYLSQRTKSGDTDASHDKRDKDKPVQPVIPSISKSSGDYIEPMDRMRKLIADHMVMSKQTSAHVTSFIEADMTRIVIWREGRKADFQKENNEKLTFTPIFLEAAAAALKEHKGVNVSVDGYNIIYRKDIHIGMATVLPDGNLIVPVIKNADTMNLAGMASAVNSLGTKARENKLSPDDIQGATFTVTNLGTFGTLTGTPVINQPNVAILAIGAIRKVPAVIETPEGDTIGIRHKVILALTYDHRIVDGALGGIFLNTMVHYLENFNIDRKV